MLKFEYLSLISLHAEMQAVFIRLASVSVSWTPDSRHRPTPATGRQFRSTLILSLLSFGAQNLKCRTPERPRV